MTATNLLSLEDRVEGALNEIMEAVRVIHLLTPDTMPDTHDQETLAAVEYIACQIGGHVSEAQAAIEEMDKLRAQAKNEPAGEAQP